MWLLPSAINSPDTTKELATAEERKPDPSAQEIRSLSDANKSSGIQMHHLPKLQKNTIRRTQSASSTLHWTRTAVSYMRF
jgi:hypothetical protein